MTRYSPSDRRTSHIWVALLAIMGTALATTTPSALSPVPAENKVDAVEGVDGPPLHQYRALRRMHARSEKLNPEGWMEAWTELEGRTFRYEIVCERGSEAVRNRVLRTLLKREQEVVAAGDPERAELTPSNYSFADETAGPGVRYVNIKPKRKDVLLVDGRMV